MRSVVYVTLGVTFLSTTFAKKPKQYADLCHENAIKEANLTNDDLVRGYQREVQEILSSQLVAEGQMLRRERSFGALR